MVEYVTVNDFYEIRLASLLTNVDKDVILELYQPLVGSPAAILYLNLLKQKRNEDEDMVFKMSKLLSMMQITPAQFLSSRRQLEGVGLLKSYEKDNGDSKGYIFVLYAPKTPHDFFDDVLFKGLLAQSIGIKEAKRLARKYEIDLNIPNDYVDISAQFIDVFSPDFNDPTFVENFDYNIVGHKSIDVKTTFNFDLFFKLIEENSQIKRNVFSEKDMQEISRIAALCGQGEKVMAHLIIDNYVYNEVPHLDYSIIVEKAKKQIRFPKLKTVISNSNDSNITSDSILAKKSKIMDETPPVKFLSLLQDNTEPAEIDVKTIDYISMKYGFSTGVLNALIDYTLTRCENILNKKFMDSVASSLKRESLDNSLDTMNYLNRVANRTKKWKTKNKNDGKIEAKNIDNNVNNSISDEEMNDIIDSIMNISGEKK